MICSGTKFRVENEGLLRCTKSLYRCVLAQSVERPPHNREVVGSIPGRVIPKDVKGGSCCYPVWRSTFERDRATSIWRCSVAAGPRSIGQKDFPFRTIKSSLSLNNMQYIQSGPPLPPGCNTATQKYILFGGKVDFLKIHFKK